MARLASSTILTFTMVKQTIRTRARMTLHEFQNMPSELGQHELNIHVFKPLV